MGVAIDTSYSIPNHPESHALFAAIIRTVGVENVFFGTDSPWEDQQAGVDATRRFLKEQRFTEEEAAAILGGNAARILGM